MHHRKFVNLIGVDGVTEKTGESSRPADVYFEKGPNLREAGGIYLDKHGKKQMMGAAKQKCTHCTTESATAVTMNCTTKVRKVQLYSCIGTP